MLSRIAFDVISAVVLALTALIGAYLPAYLATRDRLAGGTGRSLTYVLGNMLSAGVMVSAGFCHLLGEAVKQMPRMTFPLAPFLCGTGYLFTLVADKIAASTQGGHHGCGGHHSLPPKSPPGDSCCAVDVHAGRETADRGPVRLDKHSSSEPEVQGLLGRTLPRNNRQGRQHGSGGSSGALHASGPGGGSNGGGGRHGSVEHTALAMNGGIDGSSDGRLADGQDGDSAGGFPSNGGLEGAATMASRRRKEVLQRESSDSLVFEVEPGNGPLLAPGGNSSSIAGGAVGAAGRKSVSFLTAVLMGMALCFHSLLEGAAMGAQTTISNSLHIFIAIVSHKGLAAYALGSSIVDSEASMQRFWSVVLPFTFASPVGIFIGYVISDIAKGVGAASISALASGTFLYVAFMEVIPKELRDGDNMSLKLASLLLGFCLMSLLAIWA